MQATVLDKAIYLFLYKIFEKSKVLIIRLEFCD